MLCTSFINGVDVPVAQSCQVFSGCCLKLLSILWWMNLVSTILIGEQFNLQAPKSPFVNSCFNIKGKLSQEAHALACCENLKSVRLTFFKLNRQIKNDVHWGGPWWTKEKLR